jgi:hypothetical protein
MELNWKFDIPNQTLSLYVNENLSYVALRGSKDGIVKTYNGEERTISYDKWQNEKVWLDNNYSDIVGELSIPTLEERENYADKWRQFIPNIDDIPPMFGISEDGWAYDRMQRKTKLLQNADSCLMVEIGRIENVGIFETPDGKNIYKRTWCESENTYYNTMPCCVFPDNPGWQRSSLEELQEHGLDINNSWTQENLTNVQPDLLQKHFILP